jgi:phytoene desaturase
MKQRALIVGAGLGGLASALRLRAMGFDTTLLERHAELGGRARSHVEQGFAFDWGPTVITAPELIDELFALFNEKRSDWLELLPVQPWYRLIDAQGKSFDYAANMDDQLEQIARFNPDDVKGYQRLLAHALELYQKGYVELGAAPFTRIWDFLKAAPHLIRLRADKSVSKMVNEHIRDPSLRQFFSMHSLLVGGDPHRTSSIYTLIHALERNSGVWFARGGTAALVAALRDLAVRHGIKIETNAMLERVQVKQQQVTGIRLKDGREFKAEVVVSNLDPATLYEQHVPADSHRYTKAKLDRKEYSFGLYVWYFGTRVKYPNVAHHTVLFGERYKSLLDDIRLGSVPNDPSLYLHRPTATDASLAPAGCDSFYVLAPVPSQQHQRINWREQGPRLKHAIQTQLEQRLLPGLSQHICVETTRDPEYFESELGSRFGAGFSIAPKLTQSAYFRFHNRCPYIQGLYLCGAGTHPGAGIPGVLNSAKVVQHLLLERADVRAQANAQALVEEAIV